MARMDYSAPMCIRKQKPRRLNDAAFRAEAGMKSNSLCLNGLVVAREMANLTPPITLSIHGGQLLALHGSNGSGKSTLLKTIAGLLPIQQGSITYNEAWLIEPRPVYFCHKRGPQPQHVGYR